MALHNKYDKETLKQRLEAEPFSRITVSFYRYVRIVEPEKYRDQLFESWSKQGVLGRVYLASEGINAQISVPQPSWKAFTEALDGSDELRDMPLKIAVEDDGKSFYKLKIKVRDKIVADGLDDETFDVTQVGQHLTAKEFNALMELPDSVVVDMRNHYESEVGHFKGAICPDVDTFREELPLVAELLDQRKDDNVLLYCTGGIRCEKASAYLRHQGFSKVFQLHGGIIDYVRQIKKEGLENKFIGKNFVFDERMGERISDDVISSCHQCGNSSDAHTNCRNEACHQLFIQCEQCAEEYEGCCSKECLEVTLLPEEAQAELRKNAKAKATAERFTKGRFREAGIGHKQESTSGQQS